MRWQSGDRSNIEDQRASSSRRGAVPIGIGGLVLLVALCWATGADFLSLVGGGELPTQEAGQPGELRTTPEEERMVDFVDAVMADAQSSWEQLLRGRYERTRVVLFRDSTQSACGGADAATGPFYCPGDQKIYLDLGFFAELSRRFGAPGDFAQAYVVTHELGHHVQQLLGLNERATRDRRPGPHSASVALELQADCFAGVWGHAASARGRFGAGRVELEPGDAEEALKAAAAIGDDRLQKMATGHIQPERFTHGTSAQRMQWFRRGMETGDPSQCDASRARTE